jgi:O-antigen ligase
MIIIEDKNKGYVFIVAILAFLTLFMLVRGPLALELCCLLITICFLGIIACRFPYLIIILVFFLGQIMGQEAQHLLPSGLQEIAFGPLKLRFVDPILLGIVVAVMLKLLHRRKTLYKFMLRDYFLWTLLIGWLAIEVIRSFGSYNVINILGEFRTYYQYMLLIPYIVLFFRTEEEQWRLFKLLTILSFLFILTGIIRGGMLHGLGIGIGQRWFSASANLALLSGVVALYIGIKDKVLKINSMSAVLLFTAFFIMTIINGHRSVWLATGVAFLILAVAKQISFKHYILTFIAGIIGIVGVLYIFQTKGGDVFLFLDDRMMAFTDYKLDPTSNWRYILWLESLDRISQKPFFGHGFGQHFQFTSFSEMITTSPHNLYVTIAFQLGVIGFLLYLGFILQIFQRFHRALHKGLSSRQHAMILAAFVILISSSAYYIAYVFEYFTWLYVGVGIAVSKTTNANKRIPQWNQSKI